LRGRVIREFGARRLPDVRLSEAQRRADALVAEGLAPSTVRNIANAVRALYGWALPRGLATINPTTGLRLPTGGRKRDRIATLAEADILLRTLPVADRAVWATAMFAGLRLGELMALRVANVDLEARTLRADAELGSYDPVGRTFGTPKSAAGARVVPIMARLLPYLTAAVEGKPPLALVFDRDHATPFAPTALAQRARRSWGAAGARPIPRSCDGVSRDGAIFPPRALKARAGLSIGDHDRPARH
jgi:integrase